MRLLFGLIGMFQVQARHCAGAAKKDFEVSLADIQVKSHVEIVDDRRPVSQGCDGFHSAISNRAKLASVVTGHCLRISRLLFGLICRRRVRACRCAGNVRFQSSVRIVQELAEGFLGFIREAVSQACRIPKIAFEYFHIDGLASDEPRYDLVGPTQSVESFAQRFVCFLVRNLHKIASRLLFGLTGMLLGRARHCAGIFRHDPFWFDAVVVHPLQDFPLTLSRHFDRVRIASAHCQARIAKLFNGGLPLIHQGEFAWA
jgi:hypothetical protein